MTRRLQLLRMVLLGLLALTAAAWLFLPWGEGSESTSHSPPDVMPDSGREIERTAPPARRALTEPLPPRDAPLAEIASSLAALADAGDGQAACRLGAELTVPVPGPG